MWPRSHKPKLSNRRRLRSVTGCYTCRARRVKCDETKPRCANCNIRNRSCHYDRVSTVTTESCMPLGDRDASLVTDLFPKNRSVQASPVSLGQISSPEDGEAPTGDNASVQPLAAAPEASSQIKDPQPGSESRPELQVATARDNPSPFNLGSVLLLADYYDTADQPNERVPLAVDHPSDQQDQGQPQGRQAPQLFSHTPIHTSLRVDEQIELSETEVPLFRNYVENVSHWVDSFSYDSPFHRLVPVLALKCPPLLHACLALGSKQLDLVGRGVNSEGGESQTVRHYRLALGAISTLLQESETAHSDEVLASCIILSTYEMVDVVGDSVNSHLSHLPGIASLLLARQVYGDADGIRGACYWTWYRHEIWAAIRTGNVLSLDHKSWEPVNHASHEALTPHEVANRIIFVFGQCISLCNRQSMFGQDSSGPVNQASGDFASLDMSLNDWMAKLPPNMASFKLSQESDDPLNQKLWFLYPQSAIAHQVYHASKILLSIHQTEVRRDGPGLVNCGFLSLRRRIEHHRWNIFWVANAGLEAPWGLISSQCLYIAGIVTEGSEERARILGLISLVQRTTGRRTSHLCDDLKHLWDGHRALSYGNMFCFQ